MTLLKQGHSPDKVTKRARRPSPSASPLVPWGAHLHDLIHAMLDRQARCGAGDDVIGRGRGCATFRGCLRAVFLPARETRRMALTPPVRAMSLRRFPQRRRPTSRFHCGPFVVRPIMTEHPPCGGSATERLEHSGGEMPLVLPLGCSFALGAGPPGWRQRLPAAYDRPSDTLIEQLGDTGPNRAQEAMKKL